jgi:hypothetical protein
MTYILQKDIDFFGKKIPAGTKYIQHGNDYWWPVIDGAHCPSGQVDFYTVRENPEYFKREQIRVIEVTGFPTESRHLCHWSYQISSKSRIYEEDWNKIKAFIENITD